MTFAYPWVLTFLCIPVLFMLWELSRSGHQVALPFDHVEPVHKRWLNRLILGMNLFPALLLAIVICILAGPLSAGQPKQERELTNIQFCLDVSGSMNSSLSSGERRCDASVQALHDFTELRKGDAFGLTIFGFESMVIVPLTKDLKVIQNVTPYIDPKVLPYFFGGTNISSALKFCHKNLIETEEGDRLLILVTDGFDSSIEGAAGDELAQNLAADDIVVYAIHIADSNPSAGLSTITTITGGEVFAVGDKAGLERVFQHIDQMQPAKLKPAVAQKVDSYYWFAILGLVASGCYIFSLLGLRYTPW